MFMDQSYRIEGINILPRDDDVPRLPFGKLEIAVFVNGEVIL